MLVEGRTDLWADALSEESQDGSIEGVGLGEVAGGLGEVTHLAWIDGHSRELGGQEQREVVERLRDRFLANERRASDHRESMAMAEIASNQHALRMARRRE